MGGIGKVDRAKYDFTRQRGPRKQTRQETLSCKSHCVQVSERYAVCHRRSGTPSNGHSAAHPHQCIKPGQPMAEVLDWDASAKRLMDRYLCEQGPKPCGQLACLFLGTRTKTLQMALQTHRKGKCFSLFRSPWKWASFASHCARLPGPPLCPGIPVLSPPARMLSGNGRKTKAGQLVTCASFFQATGDPCFFSRAGSFARVHPR